ncbi:MAG: Crp/Fnr family transcriptional regulator [Deltaproteobacteria bacterium]|jgi:CRP/FNR family transcriptional regulator|nr:Crp/Fnr family transcriptional regulator [Deltaproteobacteria bacterium]
MNCPCDKNAGQADWSPICVGHLWLFQDLEPTEIMALAEKAHRAQYQPGQSVFMQGDRARSLFLIKSGRIRLTRALDSGAEITLDIRKAGDFLGEYLLNDLNHDYYYPVSAWCLDQVTTCGFSRPVFEELVLARPAIGLKVIKNMAGRIASLTDRLEAMAQLHLEEKIYGVLLSVAREHGRKQEGGYILEIPLTHEDLGFLVGAHRVSVTRTMKRLKESGRVDRSGKWLVILGADETNLNEPSH